MDEGTTTTTETVTMTQGCPDSFKDVGNLGGCYKTVTKIATWDAARTGCENLDSRSHLVILETIQVVIVFLCLKSKV